MLGLAFWFAFVCVGLLISKIWSWVGLERRFDAPRCCCCGLIAFLGLVVRRAAASAAHTHFNAVLQKRGRGILAQRAPTRLRIDGPHTRPLCATASANRHRRGLWHLVWRRSHTARTAANWHSDVQQPSFDGGSHCSNDSTAPLPHTGPTPAEADGCAAADDVPIAPTLCVADTVA